MGVEAGFAVGHSWGLTLALLVPSRRNWATLSSSEALPHPYTSSVVSHMVGP